jgi:hypothetical protein
LNSGNAEEICKPHAKLVGKELFLAADCKALEQNEMQADLF